MAIKVGKVKKLDSLTAEILLEGDTRGELTRLETNHAAAEAVAKAGIHAPAIVPGIKGTQYNKKTERYERLVRFKSTA